MIFVSHWVNEPSLIGKNHGVDTGEILQMYAESIRLFHPDAYLAFLTDQHTPDAPSPWTTFRVERTDKNVMGHMMKARAEFCTIEGDIVWADSDTLINRPLDLWGDWSFAVPDPFMCGVFLSRSTAFARDFFREAERRIDEWDPIYKTFGADKPVTRDISEEWKVEKISADLICYTPPAEETAYEGSVIEGNPYIVNCKGGRKRYMGKLLKEITDAHHGRLSRTEPSAA